MVFTIYFIDFSQYVKFKLDELLKIKFLSWNLGMVQPDIVKKIKVSQ